ncbi:MAG: translation initiation factor IF-3 [Oscillospiraceae bacterium]
MPCFIFFLFWRCFLISKKELSVNEAIRHNEIRVVDADGSQLGLMLSKQALDLAYSKNLDLVEISPNAKPPVCKILDYGKYRFEQSKREKESRKNQKIVDVKEIRLSLNIDIHDFNTKLGHAIKFLKSGDKVKVSIRFRGREMAHSNLGNGLLDRFKDAIGEYGIVENRPKLDGRSMIMTISPNKSTK